MTNYLITPSLLNSFKYYINDEWKSPADSRADFLKTLSRERFSPNEAMQKGIDFENDITLFCQGKYLALENCINGGDYDFIGIDEESEVIANKYDQIIYKIAKIVKGGIWQESVKKEIQVGNKTFLLYGRTDVIKRDTIFDIKFTGKYEAGKFVSSSQHRIYLYCSGLPKFQYLVSDGKEYWIEDYHNHEGIEGEIKSMISDFMDYLKNDKEAEDMFLTKWKSK